MAARGRLIPPILIIAAVVLTSAAWLRSAEYDEQYTLFVTAGLARPIWPTTAFTAGDVQALQAGHASFGTIAHDLRTTDVHPPLYFWVVAAWRELAGHGLFAARLLSVLGSLVTLCAVAAIARLSAIPAGLAVLLTLGCYGFTYAGTIARGFALAQMLSVSGVALLLLAQQRKRAGIALAAGTLLGAATFANYLAAFVGVGALLWLVRAAVLSCIRSHPAQTKAHRDHFAALAMAAGIAFAAWLPADLWFFLAQRQNRPGQFPPFDALSSLTRVGQYLAANLLGGLPLYFDDTARRVTTIAMALVIASVIALTVWQWRRIASPASRQLFAMAATAPPIGLLLLGVAFDNTPIELRYLAFATPFIGLLLAGAFATLPRRTRRVACGLLLMIQTAALGGLMIRPETMQPARRTAVAAAALVQDGIVLLPHGNDGVGIVGAFAIDAPPMLRLLVVGADETAAQIRARVDRFPRVVLALLGQDRDSRATLRIMREAFADPCWREVGEGFNVIAFARIGEEEYPCSSKPSR